MPTDDAVPMALGVALDIAPWTSSPEPIELTHGRHSDVADEPEAAAPLRVNHGLAPIDLRSPPLMAGLTRGPGRFSDVCPRRARLAQPRTAVRAASSTGADSASSSARSSGSAADTRRPNARNTRWANATYSEMVGRPHTVPPAISRAPGNTMAKIQKIRAPQFGGRPPGSWSRA